METVERLTQVLQVVDTPEALYKHVIDMHLHGTSDLLLEDLVDHSLESCSGVLQFKGHHLAAVDPSIKDECHLVLIEWMHINLVVSRVGFNKAKQFMTHHRIHQLINLLQGDSVFGTCLIEVDEVEAKSPFAAFLFHQKTGLASQSG